MGHKKKILLSACLVVLGACSATSTNSGGKDGVETIPFGLRSPLRAALEVVAEDGRPIDPSLPSVGVSDVDVKNSIALSGRLQETLRLDPEHIDQTLAPYLSEGNPFAQTNEGLIVRSSDGRVDNVPLLVIDAEEKGLRRATDVPGGELFALVSPLLCSALNKSSIQDLNEGAGWTEFITDFFDNENTTQLPVLGLNVPVGDTDASGRPTVGRALSAHYTEYVLVLYVQTVESFGPLTVVEKVDGKSIGTYTVTDIEALRGGLARINQQPTAQPGSGDGDTGEYWEYEPAFPGGSGQALSELEAAFGDLPGFVDGIVDANLRDPADEAQSTDVTVGGAVGGAFTPRP